MISLSHRIHPNRWLIWTIVVAVVVAIILVWTITIFSIEKEFEISPDQITLALHMRLRRMPIVPVLDTSQQLDTSNWKTYRNEKYGFEFKYPSNFRNPIEKKNGIDFGNVHFGYDEDIRLSVGVGGRDVQNIDQLIQELQKEESTPVLAYGGSGVSYFNFERGAFGSDDSLKLNGRYEGGFASTNFYVIHNQHLYTLSYNTETDGSSDEEFKAILSTLKFFEPNNQ
ncbi:MAG: hypothetical protein AAB482_03650 [Patescibacteria group bacterium]